MDFIFAQEMASAFDGIYPVHAVIINEYAVTLSFAYIQKNEHIELVWYTELGSGWMQLLDADGSEKQSIIETTDNYEELIEKAKTFLFHPLEND